MIQIHMAFKLYGHEDIAFFIHFMAKSKLKIATGHAVYFYKIVYTILNILPVSTFTLNFLKIKKLDHCVSQHICEVVSPVTNMGYPCKLYHELFVPGDRMAELD